MKLSLSQIKADKGIILVSFILFLLSNPYFTWELPLRPIFYLLFNLFVAIKLYSHSEQKDNFYGAFVAMWVLYALLSVAHGLVTINGFIINIVPILLYIYVAYVQPGYAQKVFHYYSWIFSIILIISLGFWFLAQSGIISSLGTIQHYNSSFDRSYTVYPFVLIEHFLDNGIRFSGPFDEAGVVGSFCSFFLCIYKFDFKDIRCIFFLLAGIFSMSLFFFVSIAVYWVLFVFIAKRNYIRGFVLLAFFFTFYLFTKDDPFIGDRLWSRLEWNQETGTFVGDNRMKDEGEIYFDKIKGTLDYYFGVSDATDYWKVAFGSSSYKNIIIMYGAIFFYSYLTFFVLFGFRYIKNKPEFFLFAFLFLLNMYQRTNLYYLDWIFIYIYMAKYANIQTHNNPNEYIIS